MLELVSLFSSTERLAGVSSECLLGTVCVCGSGVEHLPGTCESSWALSLVSHIHVCIHAHRL